MPFALPRCPRVLLAVRHDAQDAIRVCLDILGNTTRQDRRAAYIALPLIPCRRHRKAR